MKTASTALGMIDAAGYTPEDITSFHILRLFEEHIKWLTATCSSADDTGRPIFISFDREIEQNSELQMIAYGLLEVGNLRSFIEGHIGSNFTLFAGEDGKAYAHPSFSLHKNPQSKISIKVTLRRIQI